MIDKSPVILVAEDDKSVRLVVQKALTRQGFTVQSSGSAAGLWKFVESGRGDVLITDVALPDGDALGGGRHTLSTSTVNLIASVAALVRR